MGEERSRLSFLVGFGLALQFLTALPIKASFAWNEQSGKWSLRCYPLVGVILGSLLALQAYGLLHQQTVPLEMVAFYLVTFSVVFTGGLHLDGWMDCSDAFFSYRDRAKRLEIMKDPRTGAFGVLSVLFLLSWRTLFLYEVIKLNPEAAPFIFFAIPILSRISMGWMLVTAPLSREEGMAYSMRQMADRRLRFFYGVVALLLVGVAVLWHHSLLGGSLLLAMILFFLLSKRFFTVAFGGINGDTLGALTEGVESWLWMISWLLLCFVMG
ncbi:cobalamin-5-phosphate synthase CobS [Fictibacillus macauensis ZFHKF-1]|uniref:Adenosylcobinamide-GDP ribazoletransferase n=1 Tax=Fictibacillus macauensis ZFHKF-1 TaxID=1196324 RepID=I8UJR0_9BACL|nr:adenosylcobinamide-GDP ribazoletransferase [Fictibacillus macauensis]EIT87053.1 cobalamin-5-phosphate synthase CobS [Fictibacillus macauensis ZFHKF-1]